MLRPGKQHPPNNGSTGGGGGYGGYGGYGNNGYGNSGGYSNNGYGGGTYGGYAGGGSAGAGGNAGGYGNIGGYGVSSGGEDSAYSSKGSPKGHRRGSSSSSGQSFAIQLLTNKLLWIGIVIIFLIYMTLHYRGQTNELLKKLEVKTAEEAYAVFEKLEREAGQFKREFESKQRSTKHYEKRFKTASDTKKKLEIENKKMKEMYESEEHQATAEESEKLKQREEAWRKQVFLLQNATARESRREALERFGPGPHRVRFTIKVDDVDPQNPTRSFVAELAPLNLMPHAVHLFLEQVHHLLWDSTFIYLNGAHVLQVGPQKGLDKFKFTQLDTLSFPEYSHEFPHVPWTMGFTGRPGGPDWYINKADNTKPHGPGGQFQHDLEEQADSCFGKIVEGMDMLKEIVFPMRVAGNGIAILEKPVQILTARIEGATGTATMGGNSYTKFDPALVDALHKIPRVKEGMLPKNP